jgi:Double-GTPase 2
MSDVTDEPEGVGIDEVLASDTTRPTPGLIGEETDGRRPSAFDAQQANILAARTRPTVLVLAGGVACGKTSVYAAIYERLGRGEFAGRMFAGSYTIPGFEERCHYWREGSDRTSSWSKHTQGGDLPWLHLRLRDEALERAPLELLLGDFDGEFFDALISNETQPHELPFLRRADHVGVVLDGHPSGATRKRALPRRPALQGALLRTTSSAARRNKGRRD